MRLRSEADGEPVLNKETNNENPAHCHAGEREGRSTAGNNKRLFALDLTQRLEIRHRPEEESSPNMETSNKNGSYYYAPEKGKADRRRVTANDFTARTSFSMEE